MHAKYSRVKQITDSSINYFKNELIEILYDPFLNYR